MRGTDEGSGRLFSYVDLESRVRADHPLRSIRAIVNDALATLTPDFVSLYSKIGRPSIAPERLLRAMLLLPMRSMLLQLLLVTAGIPAMIITADGEHEGGVVRYVFCRCIVL